MRSTIAPLLTVVIPFAAAGQALAVQATAAQRAYYGYEENSGTNAADSSGNGLNGTHTGAVVISGAGLAPVVPPGNQRSLNFTPGPPEPGAFVSTPDNASLRFTGPFTAAAWIRPTAYAVSPANNWSVIVGKWDWVDTPGTINGWGMQLANDGKIFMFNGTNLAYTTPWSAGTVPLNQWTHVAVVFDGNFNRIYINGNQDLAVASTVAPGPSNSPLLVGGDGWIRDFAGNIDEVRLFSIALTPAEISILHAGMPAPTGLTATSGPNNVSVSWNAVPGAEGYILESGSSATGPWTLIPGASSPYVDLAATFPGTYWYRVTATGLMDSAPAGPVSASPASIAPRFADHEEGLVDRNCGCGSSLPSPMSVPWLLGALALSLACAGSRRRKV